MRQPLHAFCPSRTLSASPASSPTQTKSPTCGSIRGCKLMRATIRGRVFRGDCQGSSTTEHLSPKTFDQGNALKGFCTFSLSLRRFTVETNKESREKLPVLRELRCSTKRRPLTTHRPPLLPTYFHPCLQIQIIFVYYINNPRDESGRAELLQSNYWRRRHSGETGEEDQCEFELCHLKSVQPTDTCSHEYPESECGTFGSRLGGGYHRVRHAALEADPGAAKSVRCGRDACSNSP